MVKSGKIESGDLKSLARDVLESDSLDRRSRKKNARSLKAGLAQLGEAGDTEAWNILGGIELEIERDPRSARRWFELSTERDSAVGQRCLGHLYANGLGVRKNLSLAVELYTRSADAGDVSSMSMLADCFRDGTAGETDLVQAVRWYLTMLAYGNGDGIHAALQIAPQMTAEQIREAARLAGNEAAGESIMAVIRSHDDSL